MNGLFYAHSGLRYLVLLVALVNLVVLGLALARKAPADKLQRVLGSSFVGLLDVQVLLGVVMVAMGRYYPQLIGHIAMMVLAAVAGHVLMVMAKKRPERAVVLRLVAVLLALALIVGGIMAIGRPLFGTTVSTMG